MNDFLGPGGRPSRSVTTLADADRDRTVSFATIPPAHEVEIMRMSFVRAE